MTQLWVECAPLPPPSASWLLIGGSSALVTGFHSWPLLLKGGLRSRGSDLGHPGEGNVCAVHNILNYGS